MKMIKVDNIDLDLNDFDRFVISNMYTGKLREEGYSGPVLVDVDILYRIHGKKAKDITRMWLKIIAHNSKQF